MPNAGTIAAGAAQAVLRYQAGEYDKIAAITSCFGGARTSSGIFCSYLVSAAYCAAGPERHGRGGETSGADDACRH